MQICNIGLKIPQINLKTNTVKHFAVKSQPDTFETSKPSLKQAIKDLKQIKTPDGKERFDKGEIGRFSDLYKKNEIDLDTAKTFSDTNLNMHNMSSIYKLYQNSLKDGIDMKKNTYNVIHNQVKDIENKGHEAWIYKSLFDGKNEFIVKDETDNIRYTYSKNGEKLAKSYFEDMEINEKTIRKVTTEDYRANSINVKYQNTEKNQYINKVERCSTYKEIINYKDDNGNIAYKKVSTKSKDVPGNMNIQLVYSDGTTKDIVKSSKDEKTGIVTIKKDFTSPNGTRSQYLYENDPHGNRLIDYKITDKSGKVLYQNSQTFEKVSDTKFISSNDARKYEITVDNQSISVKDIGLGKKETIKFKKKIEKFNRDEMVNLLKKVPGHMLMEAAQDVKKYNGLQKDEALLAYSQPSEKLIASADNLFIFLHELGHIKDSETLKSKNRMVRHNEQMQYSGNKKIQDTYMKEYSAFVKKYPHEQRKEAGYFLENENHYAGKWGALGEIVAETNAIGSAVTNEASDEIILRAEYLQENFPETIAEIKNAMRWKDDIDAIEFYGT
ncbi:hypothetical protein IJ818_00650 [bacterium]|nr:hypothetical protein [bacterium]